MNNIRAITFDLDDTFWEIHPVIHRAERVLYDWLGEHRPRITAMFQPEDMRAIRKEVAAENAERAHDLTFMRRAVLSKAGTAAGYDDGFIDDAFDVFDAVRNDVALFPEVIPTLEKLSAHFTLIAVTNGNAKLDMIGIDHFFADVVTATRAGAAKPARQVFDMAVALGGASAAQTLHVGDHAEYDVVGARHAGMPTVWVNRNDYQWPEEHARPDIEVEHVGELPRLFGYDA